MEQLEIWRPVKGYEGYYEVSNFGRVRSIDRYVDCSDGTTHFIKGKLLNGKIERTGYIRITLTKYGIPKAFKAHRLVVWAFPEICGEWFEGAQVNHKNEIISDNRAENLEVCTAKYNSNYGTHSQRCAEKLKNRKDTSKPVLQFDMEGNFIKEWESVNEIERAGFNRNNVKDVLHNRKWRKSASGYKWVFKG